MLIAHSVMVSQVADTPKAVAVLLKDLHGDLSYLRSINSELDSMNRQMETVFPHTVTVVPAVYATFTMTAR